MRTSLSSFLYLNYSLNEAIQHIAMAGFDAVDIWGGRPHAYRNDLHEHDIRSLHNQLDDFGLEIASFIPAQCDLCSPHTAIRMDGIRDIQTSIELAARLEASIISILPGHSLHHQCPDEGWDLLADSLARIGEFAGHYDVLLAIEPADKYASDLINTTVQAMDMIDQIGCDNFGVVFDTGHALIAGEDTDTAIRALGDRLFHIHLSDNHRERDERLIPGKGRFDFQTLIATLKSTQFEGFLTAEPGWQYTLDPDSAAIETREFLEFILQE
jgi:protein FrlC